MLLNKAARLGSVIYLNIFLLASCGGSGSDAPLNSDATLNTEPKFITDTVASMTENNVSVMKVTASDDEGDTLTYSLTGSIDDTLFNIDTNTGALTFKVAPDFETPADNGGDNSYDVQVTVTDGSLSANQSITIAVSNVNELPVISSTAAVTLDENQTYVVTVAALDPEGVSINYSLTGSIDDALFNIDTNTGALTFKVAPDYESPTDFDIDNIYLIEVTASDGVLVTSQSITVNVSDILDLAVSSAGVKTLTFYWSGFTGASFYKLLVNPDGNSGYTQEGSDINSASVNVIIPVHLTDWVNASYMLEAYDSSGLLESSSPINITDQMLQVIGELASSNPTADNTFRSANIAVSDDGSTIVVGDAYEDSSTTGINSTPNFVSSSYNGGAVYVFVKDGLSWTRQAYIKASNTGDSDFFGQSVALSGDGSTLAVGASYEDSSTKGINTIPNDLARDAGAAYIFTRFGTNWSQQAYIKASNTPSFPQTALFGHSIDLSVDGDTLVVGSRDESSETGAAYIFTRSSSTWSEQALLRASNATLGYAFGISTALSSDGNTLAVGSYYESSAATGVDGDQIVSCPATNCSGSSGAVYIFTRNVATWSQQAYIKASNTGSTDYFGYTLDLSGDGNTLVVGALNEDSVAVGLNGSQDDAGGPTYNAGAVYLFNRAGSVWSQSNYIKAFNTGAGDAFGTIVSLSRDGITLAVGAPGERSDSVGVNPIPNDDAVLGGAVYIYTFDGFVWKHAAFVKSPRSNSSTAFGNWLGLNNDGSTLVIGTDRDNVFLY